MSLLRAQSENWTQIKHQMYTLRVIELFSMIIFSFLQVSFSSRPLPLFTISLLFKIVIQVRYPPSFSAEFTKSFVFVFFGKLPLVISQESLVKGFVFWCLPKSEYVNYLCALCNFLSILVREACKKKQQQRI